jgi:hypothetical protein
MKGKRAGEQPLPGPGPFITAINAFSHTRSSPIPTVAGPPLPSDSADILANQAGH